MYPSGYPVQLRLRHDDDDLYTSMWSKVSQGSLHL